MRGNPQKLEAHYAIIRPFLPAVPFSISESIDEIRGKTLARDLRTVGQD
jgi:hypothetical protein